LARRTLTKLKIADKFPGVVQATGDYKPYKEEDVVGPRPFKALLDVGLARTTTGTRIFGVVKGAVDGGLHVPHSNRRFVGYDEEKNKFDPKVLRNYIYGKHVSEYMEEVKDEEPKRYEKIFSRYIKEKITPDSLEKIYKDAHQAIRKDPAFVPTKKPENPKHIKYGPRKLTPEERKDKIIAKLEALAAQLEAEQPLPQ